MKRKNAKRVSDDISQRGTYESRLDTHVFTPLAFSETHEGLWSGLVWAGKRRTLDVALALTQTKISHFFRKNPMSSSSSRCRLSRRFAAGSKECDYDLASTEGLKRRRGRDEY